MPFEIPKELWVSLDVFDTAILRHFAEPRHLFDAVEEETGVKGFARARIQAEIEVREQLRRQGIEECRLESIYQRMRYHLPKLTKSDLEALSSSEISFEVRNALTNPEIHSFYEKLLEANKKILFISDMYLSKKTIETLLRNTGYHTYHRLYVSSEEGYTKSSGRLFGLVLNQENLKASELFHFGDNEESDGRRAIAQGIRSLVYKRKILIDSKESSEIYPSRLSTSKAFAGRVEKNNPWSALGIGYGRLIYGGMLQWISAQMREQELEAGYFLSRDGHILKTASDMVGALGEKPSYYLHGARKTLVLSNIQNRLTAKNLHFLMEGAYRPPVEYLTRIGVPHADAFVFAKKFFGRLQNLRSFDGATEQLQKMLLDAEDVILERCSKIRERTLQYLLAMNFKRYQRVGLIDLGWHGSMQDALQDLLETLGISIEIHGLYFGLGHAASRARQKGRLMHSLTTSEFYSEKEVAQTYAMVVILELLHAAPHGGVIDYAKNPDGSIMPLLAQNEVEQMQYQSSILHFQKAALSHLSDIYPSLKPEDAILAARDLILNPSRRELSLLSSLFHSDGFEHTGAYKRVFEMPESSDPEALIQAYRDSYWPAGFLRALQRRPMSLDSIPFLHEEFKILLREDSSAPPVT